MKSFLISIILFLFIATGCATTAYVDLDVMQPIDPLPVVSKGHEISLLIGDYRDKSSIFETDSKMVVYTYQKPSDILWAAYKNALEKSGFSITSSASITYIVKLIDFYVTWPTGLNVPVTGKIKIATIVQNDESNEKLEKVFSSQKTKIAHGGGVVGDIPNIVLQECLNQVIFKSLSDQTVLSVLQTGGSAEPWH